MDHLRPVSAGDPSEDPPGTTGAAPDLADLLRRAGRADEAAFAELYDATSRAGLRHGAPGRPRPGAGRGGHPGGVPRDLAHRRPVRPGPGQPARLDADHHAPQGGRPGPLRRGVHPPRHDVPPDATSRSTTTRPRKRSSASLEAHRVRGALQTLTEVQREAIGLAYFGGYTHTEVATMLDLPVGTAKTRIRDGLIRLRDAMGVGS